MPENQAQQNYALAQDEELALLAQNGDAEAERALVLRFMPLVRMKSRPYFLIGADSADLVQEGAIGLLSAIRDFKPEKNVSFRSYAEVCIANNVFAAIKRAARKKHMPLNSSISLDKPIDGEDGGSETFGDRLNSVVIVNPEELAIKRESELRFSKKLEESLTDLEMRALMLFLNGKSYKQIALEMDRSTKAVDNALQRVKKKVAALLGEEHRAED